MCSNFHENPCTYCGFIEVVVLHHVVVLDANLDVLASWDLYFLNQKTKIDVCSDFHENPWTHCGFIEVDVVEVDVLHHVVVVDADLDVLAGWDLYFLK